MKTETIAVRTERLRRQLGITLKQATELARKQLAAEKLAAKPAHHYYSIERAGFSKPVQVCIEGKLEQCSVNSMLAHVERVEREFTGVLRGSK
jgi:hypothetical protein